ncbi:hypothetical protein ABZP36_002202, partial [Zizania latifolia]
SRTEAGAWPKASQTTASARHILPGAVAPTSSSPSRLLLAFLLTCSSARRLVAALRHSQATGREA